MFRVQVTQKLLESLVVCVQHWICEDWQKLLGPVHERRTSFSIAGRKPARISLLSNPGCWVLHGSPFIYEPSHKKDCRRARYLNRRSSSSGGLHTGGWARRRLRILNAVTSLRHLALDLQAMIAQGENTERIPEQDNRRTEFEGFLLGWL